MDGPAGKSEPDSATCGYVMLFGSNRGLEKVDPNCPKMPDREVTSGQSGEVQELPESEKK